jgi:hypothetical protein
MVSFCARGGGYAIPAREFGHRERFTFAPALGAEA